MKYSSFIEKKTCLTLDIKINKIESYFFMLIGNWKRKTKLIISIFVEKWTDISMLIQEEMSLREEAHDLDAIG